MDEKINNIILMMADSLDGEQLDKLKNALFLVLYEKPLGENELMCVDDNTRIINMFFASLKMCNRSDKTIEKYALDIKKMLEFFHNKSLLEIKPDEMKYYLMWYKTYRQVSNTTLEGMRVVFKTFFQWLVDNDYLDKSPMRTINPIKKDTIPERELSDTEIEKFKNACKSSRDRAMIEFLYSTGCRITEMCNCKISDINWDKSEVQIIGKGDKPRIVYLTDTAKYYLEEYLNSRTDQLDILFISNKGEPRQVKRNSVERLFARLSDKAGVERIHPHRFRVKRICTIVNRTDNMVVAQAIAGHSNIATTEKYYRKNQSHIKSEFFRIA